MKKILIWSFYLKTIIFLFALTFLASPLFAFVVKSDELTSRYGISYQERQNSNYIVKGDYSFSYLGNGTWDVKVLTSNSLNNSSNNNSKFNYVLFIIIASVIHIIITICVYNIKGGSWAVLYFILAPIALLILLFVADHISTNSFNNSVAANRKKSKITSVNKTGRDSYTIHEQEL
jgi:hypothetical protein